VTTNSKNQGADNIGMWITGKVHAWWQPSSLLLPYLERLSWRSILLCEFDGLLKLGK
jgi:hypothetical protein